MVKLELTELSARQRAILTDLDRVRLLSGRQIERLHFGQLAAANSRGSARRRLLGQLVAAGFVVTLPRRVGGERAGSAGLLYALDARGRRLLAASVSAATAQRVRRPWAIGWPFVQHTLDIAELYVRLREREAEGTIELLEFATEPTCWFAVFARRVLKPDAWAVYQTADWEEHWWIEVDHATESLTTLRRKLGTYVDFAQSGQPGPLAVVPRVLLTVPSPARLAAARSLIATLPPPAAALIHVTLFRDALALPARPPP